MCHADTAFIRLTIGCWELLVKRLHACKPMPRREAFLGERQRPSSAHSQCCSIGGGECIPRSAIHHDETHRVLCVCCRPGDVRGSSGAPGIPGGIPGLSDAGGDIVAHTLYRQPSPAALGSLPGPLPAGRGAPLRRPRQGLAAAGPAAPPRRAGPDPRPAAVAWRPPRRAGGRPRGRRGVCAARGVPAGRLHGRQGPPRRRAAGARRLAHHAALKPQSPQHAGAQLACAACSARKPCIPSCGHCMRAVCCDAAAAATLPGSETQGIGQRGAEGRACDAAGPSPGSSQTYVPPNARPPSQSVATVRLK